MLKLLLWICLLFGFAQVAAKSLSAKIAYVDSSGLHFANTTPSGPVKRDDIFIPSKFKGRDAQNNVPYVIQVLWRHKAQQFCSSFLHIIPYAATTTATKTQTVSKEAATIILTSTSTSDPGTTTTTTTETSSTTTTSTFSTVTITFSTTSTTTATDTTITATTYLHTGPRVVARRSIQNVDCPIPDWLPFPSKIISSACSHIVTRKTKTSSKTATSTQSLTTTTTASTTTTLPLKTLIITSTTSTTGTFSATETDSTTTTLPASTTTTLAATATQCAMSFPIDGGGIGNNGGNLNYYQADATPDACCTRCYNTNGCGLWFFFSGFGCFNAANVNGPNPSTQCPTGFGQYVVINGTAGDGNVGGEGPCDGGFVY